jgi:hypothetical protein
MQHTTGKLLSAKCSLATLAEDSYRGSRSSGGGSWRAKFAGEAPIDEGVLDGPGSQPRAGIRQQRVALAAEHIAQVQSIRRVGVVGVVCGVDVINESRRDPWAPSCLVLALKRA